MAMKQGKSFGSITSSRQLSGQPRNPGLTLRLAGLFVLALALAQPAASAPFPKKGKSASNGEMLAQSCFACHGPRGASVASPMPIIGGQNAAYLMDAMTAFKNTTRPATIMTRLVDAYSEQEIMAMTQYIASQPYVRAQQAVDGAKVEIGREVYARACKKCHIDGGRESSESEYPLVAGQWLPYMQMSMADILAGKRAVDDKFKAALDKLSRDEIDAVLHFFAAQR